MKLTREHAIALHDNRLSVNGKPFEVLHPAEPLFAVRDGKLITIVFRGCGCTLNEWDPEEIEGEYAT